MNIIAEDIRRLIKQGEGLNLEMKSCKDSIPRSVWETYSSFANTRGGVILLGITEHKDNPIDSRFEISGVEDSIKVVTDFWNIINNPQKVSLNYLVDSDVRIIEIDGVSVIYINVPEADYHKKPIYLNNNLQNGTYKRSHEGDRHVTKDELALLLRDSSDEIDSQIIEHYTMDDIDIESLHSYRKSFETANPTHAYKNLDDKEFLRQMGGYKNDRHRGVEGLTMGGLLMFGKRLPILEVFPTFRIDYLDLIGVKPGSSLKWNDRLTDDGRWEPNLYNFATLVMRKLLFTVPTEGRLHGTIRKDGGDMHEAIREATINTISYCDYKLNGVLRIDRKTDCIIFRNPGTLRISRERIYDGDFTHARNRTIQLMFRMIGYGDNIGSGFQKILAAWKSLGYDMPDLKEYDDIQEVWLTLPLKSNSQINSQISQDIQAGISGDSTEKSILISQINSHINLSNLQRSILTCMVKNPQSSINEIATILKLKVETIRYQRRLMSNIVQTEKIGSNKQGNWRITFN